MPNKTINVKTLCPFFVCEHTKSITCEGVIGENQISRFDMPERKKVHQECFCTTWNFRLCPLYRAISLKHEERTKYENSKGGENGAE